MNISLQVMKSSIGICWVVLLWLLAGTAVCAQSIDVTSPSPVRTNEVVGRIAARDLGDARLTDHFYAFTGPPGDVLITIQGTNLNGDVDVFTAGSLRPLLKFVLYAESASPITKSIYLRRREKLILRVEARSPNDDEGLYQLRFGGSFEPVIGGPEIADNEAPSSAATGALGQKARRVNSVGARINEPAPPVSEVAVAPTPEPTPIESPSPEATKEKPAEVKAPKPSPPRSARSPSRQPAGRRATASASPKPERKAATGEPNETPEPETASKPPARSSARRGASPSAKPKPPPEPVDETGPRLIIETYGGNLINRPMRSVRRVTVENGLVVVVGIDGKIDRIQLVNIVRMTIQP